MEDNLKRAFERVKGDINFLNNEILDIKVALSELNSTLKKINLRLENQENTSSTLRHKMETNTTNSTHISTVPSEIEGLKTENMDISIGNQGVSTDRQTDNKTDNSTDFSPNLHINNKNNIDSSVQEVTKILNSLDSLKKEIRLKFKHLTTQEMLVFSTIYQLEEQNTDEITYKLLSKSLKLSESSIRDYVQRITNKGISIDKKKVNNKKLLLSISPELKKIASLSTILQLREL